MVIKFLLNLLINLWTSDYIANFIVNVILGHVSTYSLFLYMSLGFGLLLKLFLLLLIIFVSMHIRLGVKAILHDYVYNKSIVFISSLLHNLILLRLVIEIIMVSF